MFHFHPLLRLFCSIVQQDIPTTWGVLQAGSGLCLTSVLLLQLGTSLCPWAKTRLARFSSPAASICETLMALLLQIPSLWLWIIPSIWCSGSKYYYCLLQLKCTTHREDKRVSRSGRNSWLQKGGRQGRTPWHQVLIICGQGSNKMK